MSYALFMVVLLHGGQTIGIDGFGSKEACEKAAAQITQTIIPGKNVGTLKREELVRYTCVAKGSKW